MSYTDEQYEQAKELLLQHQGKGNEITSRELNEELGLDNVGSFPQTRELVRDIIFEERIPIIGGGNGYYVAKDEQEIKDAVESLDGRITNTAERRMMLVRAAENWRENIDTDDDLDVL
jgi:hypothetical protein